MARQAFLNLLRVLRRRQPVEDGLTDGDLLNRFVETRDEAAFETLVWRHADLVYSVCRRITRGSHDAEDAFQVTFLALARKARTLRRQNALSGWLYRVAYRAALAIRERSKAQPAQLVGDPAAPAVFSATEWHDVRQVLDQEILHLPAKYRLPFVLCHVQGKTNAEAAQELKCPTGTILSRLNWARARLRQRLTQRGVTLSAVAGTFCWLATRVNARSPGLEARTVTIAQTGVASPTINLVTQGVINTMAWKNATLAGALGILLVGGTGAGMWGLQNKAEPGQNVAEANKRLVANQVPDPDPRDDKSLADAKKARALQMAMDKLYDIRTAVLKKQSEIGDIESKIEEALEDLRAKRAITQHLHDLQREREVEAIKEFDKLNRSLENQLFESRLLLHSKESIKILETTIAANRKARDESERSHAAKEKERADVMSIWRQNKFKLGRDMIKWRQPLEAELSSLSEQMQSQQLKIQRLESGPGEGSRFAALESRLDRITTDLQEIKHELKSLRAAKK